jgi:UDP-N-acetyl-D-galactosamine dehydrogenase
MGRFVAQRAIKEIICAGHDLRNAVVTVLGLTFKEDCPDLRNSKVVDIVDELREYGIEVQVHDPMADPREALHEYKIELKPFDSLRPATAVILAVAHKPFIELSVEKLSSLMKEPKVLVDVKSVYPPEVIRQAGIRLWRL